MSNEFKYGIQGLLMAIGFFAALQIISFLKIISESNKEDNLSQASVTVSAEISIKNTEGKRLFNQNCAACHAVNKRLTGPALAGVEERIPNRKILYEWIRNNQKVLQSGDAYFNTLYKAYD